MDIKKAMQLYELRAYLEEKRAEQAELEERYNPYHDPTNGRFASASGGTNVMGYSGAGGLLVVDKGQKGKGYLVGVSNADMAEDAMDNEFAEWQKKHLTNSDPDDKIERKVLDTAQKRDDFLREVADDTSKDYAPDEIAGVKRGNPMTPEQADGNRPNPHYGQGEEYSENCQTCVVAYEMRLRGYDVEAIGNNGSNACRVLAGDTERAWNDPSTGENLNRFKGHWDKTDLGREKHEGEMHTLQSGYSRFMTPKTLSTPKIEKFLEQNIESDGRYHLSYKNKGRKYGHIVTIQRNSAGALEIYDPQTGFRSTKVRSYIAKNISKGSMQSIDLLRVDRLAPNPTMLGQVLKGRNNR